MSDIKHVLIVGAPTRMVEDDYPHLDLNAPVAAHEVFRKFGGFTYVSSVCELVDPDTEATDELTTDVLITFIKRGGLIYIGSPVEKYSVDEKALLTLDEMVPERIIDEALELLQQQIGVAVNDPIEFETAVEDAKLAHLDPLDPSEKVLFTVAEEENTAAFHAPYRISRLHTIKWCSDGSVELDGAILRRTALMGTGHLKTKVLGGGVLEPNQVVGFIAHRMALVGPDDFVGYGRAFGPGKEDQTNATLTQEGREFRSQGIVGVVTVNLNEVHKAKPQLVEAVARALHTADPEGALFLHQQGREIYEGPMALKAFRGTQEGVNVTLTGKSTKHTRVDAGAYCLYTQDGSGTVTMPAVIGNFEFSNDGSIYVPSNLLNTVSGYLKENVKAIRDFAKMSPELLARYYSAEVVVAEGDRIEPGAVVFKLDGVEHTWTSKADYGVVTHVIDRLTSKLVHCEVRIDAYFVGDCKMRGFGKGLMCPAEAAGVHSPSHSDHILIGAAGIIKDSAAALSKMSNVRTESAWVTIQFCDRDFELVLAKHNPAPCDDFTMTGCVEKDYPDLCKMVFDCGAQTVCIIDDNATVCDITFMIEASPVGQSVGSSSMTLPQMGFLSSLPTGNKWLCEQALPGIHKRTNALAYLHAVANGIPLEV